MPEPELKPPCKTPMRFHPGEYLAEELQARGWGAVQLAERTGLSPQEIRDFVNGEGRWNINEWERVARALGTSIELWLRLQLAWKKDQGAPQ